MQHATGLQFLKWSVALLLVAMLAGGAWMLYFGPVNRYAISCAKGVQVSCLLERHTNAGHDAWRMPLGAHAVASVRVRTLRRSGPQVLLYLDGGTRSVFAAQFEGNDAVADANIAAATLNRLFAAPGPGSVRVEANAPSSMRIATWAGFGFFALLVVVVLRELFRREVPRVRSSASERADRSA